jgi:hypothetical protein
MANHGQELHILSDSELIEMSSLPGLKALSTTVGLILASAAADEFAFSRFSCGAARPRGREASSLSPRPGQYLRFPPQQRDFAKGFFTRSPGFEAYRISVEYFLQLLKLYLIKDQLSPYVFAYCGY